MGVEDGCRVDLRSDTVTMPTEEMLAAISSVTRFGDDGWGDDETVKLLEAEAAAIFQKEAGLFTPTGIMANLISVLCHCEKRGSEAIVGSLSHLCLYEQGGMATVGGVHSRQLPNNSDGTIDLGDIESAIRADDPHFPRTRLICLENTHNHCGGRVLSLSYMRRVREIAQANGIPTHLDGARVMNACAKLGCKPAEIGEHFDTVSFCLSKSLGAPIGSVIVGNAEFIARCHRLRKCLGGQLRQVAVLAAPGLIALKRMPSRLSEDHDQAKRLAEGISKIEGLEVDLGTVETNMVMVNVSACCESAEAAVAALKEVNVLTGIMGKGILRLVTHHHIREAQVQKAVEAFARLAASRPANGNGAHA